MLQQLVVGPPLSRVHLQTVGHKVRERRGPPSRVSEGGGRAERYLEESLHRTDVREGRPCVGELEESDSERPDVCFKVIGHRRAASFDDLRSHPIRRSNECEARRSVG